MLAAVGEDPQPALQQLAFQGEADGKQQGMCDRTLERSKPSKRRFGCGLGRVQKAPAHSEFKVAERTFPCLFEQIFHLRQRNDYSRDSEGISWHKKLNRGLLGGKDGYACPGTSSCWGGSPQT